MTYASVRGYHWVLHSFLLVSNGRRHEGRIAPEAVRKKIRRPGNWTPCREWYQSGVLAVLYHSNHNQIISRQYSSSIIMSAAPRDDDDDDAVREYRVRYGVRDVLLYATAVGFGSADDVSRYEADLPFVWEGRRRDVRVLPTWACCLPFWATAATTTEDDDDHQRRHRRDDNYGRLPSFPPPVMDNNNGILPSHCLRRRRTDANAVNVGEYPLLHTRECLQWRRRDDDGVASLRVSGSYRLRRVHVAVVPKPMGTFVTTQTQIIADDDDAEHNERGGGIDEIVVCTMQSTALILGLDPERVRPWTRTDASLLSSPQPHPPRDFFRHDATPDYTESVRITSQHALLYRLASGDTNAIHVHPASNPLGGDDDDHKCVVLHGLATLGMVARVVEQQYNHHDTTTTAANGHNSNSNNNNHWRHLEANFTHPVSVGDTIDMQLWKKPSSDFASGTRQPRPSLCVVYFRVVVRATHKVAVDGGMAVLETAMPPSRL